LLLRHLRVDDTPGDTPHCLLLGFNLLERERREKSNVFQMF